MEAPQGMHSKTLELQAGYIDHCEFYLTGSLVIPVGRQNAGACANIRKRNSWIQQPHCGARFAAKIACTESLGYDFLHLSMLKRNCLKTQSGFLVSTQLFVFPIFSRVDI